MLKGVRPKVILQKTNPWFTELVFCFLKYFHRASIIVRAVFFVAEIAKKKILLWVIAGLIFIFSFSPVLAAMQSDNYIIYETVMHEFDGPIITNITCTAGETSLTIAWDTDVTADAFVVYSTDGAMTDPKEQGSSVKNSLNHSVIVAGLTSATTYYYQAKSTRINGGTTLDATIRSCTTNASSAPAPVTPVVSSAGGGMLIIDKRDRVAPVITNASVTEITPDSLTLSWQTDEAATSFMEYGQTTGYGDTYGSWATTTNHSVKIENLLPAITYHLRALSSDSSGNYTYSADLVAVTLTAEGEEAEPETATTTEEEEGLPEETIAAASARIIELLNRFANQVSLNFLETTLGTQYNTIQRVANLIPAPILSGEPRVEAETTKAKVYWGTDKPASSQVALSPEAEYYPDRDEPYRQIIGNAAELTTEHEVDLFGLEPDTLYHFQIRSLPAVGPAAVSRDYTFRTRLAALEITSFFAQIIDNQTAVFKWVTNKEADSAVTFAPYRGSTLSVDEAKTVKDDNFSVIHEVTVTEFAEGVKYDIELASQDEAGNVAREVLPMFTTSADDRPPEVSHIQTDSTIFADQGGKIQTIISWRTNEPSTSRVYYQEGVLAPDAELTDNTGLNTDYTREHVVVVTKFKAGVVYSFRVESIDSGGNTVLSNIHTFMTPKKKESIFQIIMRILEETFGWVKKLSLRDTNMPMHSNDTNINMS